MRLTIEIIAALLLVLFVGASSAAVAAGEIGRSGEGLSCAFSVPHNASPAANCAGRFHANYAGDRIVANV